MTAEYKYSCRNMQNFQQQDQTQLSEKGNSFLDFLFRFTNVHQVYNILEKKMSLLAAVFPKLLTPQELVT